MTVVPRRQIYLTALSILLVVLLLLVFISVSTYRNLNRERDAARETVHRQALTLINALEAGARAGMMMQMAGKDAIGNLVHEIGRSGDVNYLYLVLNLSGRMMSEPGCVGWLTAPTFMRWPSPLPPWASMRNPQGRRPNHRRILIPVPPSIWE
ncbi:MAG: hypothetical protein HGJ94_01790 [Desulfosarcina sp.]|nr:hypothetical protein [Desulfosarcina sp.]